MVGHHGMQAAHPSWIPRKGESPRQSFFELSLGITEGVALVLPVGRPDVQPRTRSRTHRSAHRPHRRARTCSSRSTSRSTRSGRPAARTWRRVSVIGILIFPGLRKTSNNPGQSSHFGRSARDRALQLIKHIRRVSLGAGAERRTFAAAGRLRCRPIRTSSSVRKRRRPG